MRITSSVSLNAKRIQLYEVRRNSSKVSLSTWTAERVLLCNKALFVCFLRCLRLVEKNKHALQTMRSFESESESHSVVSDSATPGLYSPWNSPGQNTGVGSPSLFQGIFPTQGSNPGLPHCRLDSLPAEPQRKPYKSFRNPRTLDFLAFIFLHWSFSKEKKKNIAAVVQVNTSTGKNTMIQPTEGKDQKF